MRKFKDMYIKSMEIQGKFKKKAVALTFLLL